MQNNNPADAIDTAPGQVWHNGNGGALVVVNNVPEK